MEGVKALHPLASEESTLRPTQNRPSSRTATLRRLATGTEEDRAAVEGRAGAAAVAAAGAANRKGSAALHLHVRKNLLCLSRRITLSCYC